MAERDDLHRGLVSSPGNKPFRRVKKHVGEEWKPDQRKQPNMELGPWCDACRTNHPWRNKKVLAAAYEKSGAGNWIINWTCVKTGNVIKAQGLIRR